jgi:hypothetical protein
VVHCIRGLIHMFSDPGLIHEGLVQALYCDVGDLAYDV